MEKNRLKKRKKTERRELIVDTSENVEAVFLKSITIEMA